MTSKEKEYLKKIEQLEVWLCFMNSCNHNNKHIPVFKLIVTKWMKEHVLCEKFFDKYIIMKVWIPLESLNTLVIWPHGIEWILMLYTGISIKSQCLFYRNTGVRGPPVGVHRGWLWTRWRTWRDRMRNWPQSSATSRVNSTRRREPPKM